MLRGGRREGSVWGEGGGQETLATRAALLKVRPRRYTRDEPQCNAPSPEGCSKFREGSVSCWILGGDPMHVWVGVVWMSVHAPVVDAVGGARYVRAAETSQPDIHERVCGLVCVCVGGRGSE